MNYQHYNLGFVEKGSVVEVSLSGSAANLRLMDGNNFANYKAGRRHSYIGGLAKRSPTRLAVPQSGSWHLTVDMQGLKGTVRTSARLIPRTRLEPLPEIPEAPLESVPSLVREPQPEFTDVDRGAASRQFDVFISHASEDKNEIVRPLANALRDAGLEVWYDEFELRIGDSLRKKIDEGLNRSRFGVVVLSSAFLGRDGPSTSSMD